MLTEKSECIRRARKFINEQKTRMSLLADVAIRNVWGAIIETLIAFAISPLTLIKAAKKTGL